MKKRLLAVCLCLVMLAGMVPAARAGEAGGSVDNGLLYIPVEEIPEGEILGISAPHVAAGPTTFSAANPRALKPGETLRRGIDVSAWQDDIDWKKVAASGVEFAIIRACGRGYGTAGTLYQDSKFQRNIEGARANGILVGAYVFSQALTVEEARQEARLLMNMVQDYNIDLPLVLDYETTDGNGRLTQAINTWLTPSQVTRICNAFCAEVEDYGYESMVYANKYFLERHMVPSAFNRVWAAQYYDQCTYGGAYEFWQFSSSGRISGISGYVDMDFWFDPGNYDGPYRANRYVDKELDSGQMRFPDVHRSDWFYAEVKAAYDRGIVQGTDLGIFQPLGTATRGQTVTMLYRMSGSPAVSGTSPFRDLTQEYYKKPVLWAYKTGIMKGYWEEQFAPEDMMTRQDLVTVLYRRQGSPAVTGSLGSFQDTGRISDYAWDAMSWAVEQGILKGDDANRLRPRAGCSRAEACAILMRYYDKFIRIPV